MKDNSLDIFCPSGGDDMNRTGEMIKERIAQGMVAVSGGETGDGDEYRPKTLKRRGFSKEVIRQAEESRRRLLNEIKLFVMPGASEKEILKVRPGLVDPDPVVRK